MDMDPFDYFEFIEKCPLFSRPKFKQLKREIPGPIWVSGDF
jgi:hypothetical protein